MWGVSPCEVIGTPTAGKSASLTFRLVLRASQPITMSNKVENTKMRRPTLRLCGFWLNDSKSIISRIE